MLNTPVLFLVFNRLDTTKQVFSRIREVKPKQLFIAADGPREGKDGEKEIVESVRNFILESIDWDCEVKTLFREKNLGCGLAVSQGITWFFENVEQGIILEDDCLPETSFFFFCEQMLEQYYNETTIGSVCGTNYLFYKYKFENSYYFSNLGAIWGWATWRRVWAKYQFYITKEDITQLNLKLDKIKVHKKIKKWIISMLEEVRIQNINTWDIQWIYSLFTHNYMSIIPYKNQIKNIGYIGTHASNTERHHPFFNMPTFVLNLNKIKHPYQIKVNSKLDNVTYRTIIKYALVKDLTSYIKEVVHKYILRSMRLHIKKIYIRLNP